MSIRLRSTSTALRVTCLLCRAPLHDRRALCVLRDHDYLSVPRACLHACPNSSSTGRMVFFHVPAAHDDNHTVGQLWRAWDPFSANISPRAVIGPGPVPAPLIRKPPVSVIEEYVHVETGSEIDTGPGITTTGRAAGTTYAGGGAKTPTFTFISAPR